MNDVGILLGGSVTVNTTSYRGLTPEEIASQAVNRIISVGSQSHPVIRDQAQAFKDHIEKVVLYYINEAIKNDRSTIAFRLLETGHPHLIDLLDK